ncbi:MAG TPA: glucuronate isomerase [Streptosporangiaceae bacterium]|nr:glucuronate isomerase [Streptosporangiaceae bacterium]
MPTTDARRGDRLLPADPPTRDVARHLYEQVAGAPIISPHGHVPARLLAEDQPFSDPATLFVSSDHYVTRQLHASGVPLEALSVVRGADPREVWRTLAGHAHALAGTASAFWLRDELASVFGIDHDLTPGNADEAFDHISAQLRQPEFLPRALFNRFGIRVLATTDDPLDSLDAHQALSESATFAGRVVPTLRADAYIDPAATSFRVNAESLLTAAGAPATFAGYLSALKERRAYFLERGAVSVDVGVTEPATAELTAPEAERLFQRALKQALSPEDQRTLCAHLLLQLAAMSVEDGLVLTIHAGVYRNHSTPTWERFGPDTGHDIPVPVSFTRGLHPLLDRFGLEPNLHLILFTPDETTFSRELAPLAGFYPSVYIGAPWWFLDAPDAILRWRSAITETAGFYRTSGFIDDTRAFLSIPARHDVSRRTDASFLARYAVEGRITVAMAERIIADLVDGIPRTAFKL